MAPMLVTPRPRPDINQMAIAGRRETRFVAFSKQRGTASRRDSGSGPYVLGGDERNRVVAFSGSLRRGDEHARCVWQDCTEPQHGRCVILRPGKGCTRRILGLGLWASGSRRRSDGGSAAGDRRDRRGSGVPSDASGTARGLKVSRSGRLTVAAR
jgi:hypothetical protein